MDREAKKYRPLVYICSRGEGEMEKIRKYSRFAVEQEAIPLAPDLLLSQYMKRKNRI